MNNAKYLTLSGLVAAALVFAAAFSIGVSAQDTSVPKSKTQAKTPAEKPAPAAGESDKGDLSMRAVKVITGFALTTIPSEITQADGKVMKIDKSDMSKLIVPLDDARRVIKVAYLSAQAQDCDMPEVQTENYLTLIGQERASKKWTEEQLLFINRLHLFTVMWLTGNVKIEEKDGKEEAKITTDLEKTKKKTCSTEDKEKLRTNIETYWTEADKKKS